MEGVPRWALHPHGHLDPHLSPQEPEPRPHPTPAAPPTHSIDQSNPRPALRIAQSLDFPSPPVTETSAVAGQGAWEQGGRGASLSASPGRGPAAGGGSCPRGAAGLGAPGRPVCRDRRGPGVPGSQGFCWACFWGRNAIHWRPGLIETPPGLSGL